MKGIVALCCSLAVTPSAVVAQGDRPVVSEQNVLITGSVLPQPAGLRSEPSLTRLDEALSEARFTLAEVQTSCQPGDPSQVAALERRYRRLWSSARNLMGREPRIRLPSVVTLDGCENDPRKVAALVRNIRISLEDAAIMIRRREIN